MRLISTQVVEVASILIFRLFFERSGRLTESLQAAGRCNREGTRWNGLGKVIVFDPVEGKSPSGPYKIGLEQAKVMVDPKTGNY